jgi:hypothetical protein
MPGLSTRRIVWGDETFGAAKRAELQIFGVANGYASKDDVAAGEMLAYREWERTTEFHLAYATDDRQGDVIGVVRFLRYDPDLGFDSFSTIRDARSYAPPGRPPATFLDPSWDRRLFRSDPASFAELATQAILRPGRRGGAVDHLWYSLIRVSQREGVTAWTMALVLPLFRVYKAMFPTAMHAIGEVLPDYIGADSVPALLRVDHSEIIEYQERFEVAMRAPEMARAQP